MTVNLLTNAHYLLSADNPTYWPADSGCEVAFTGRSNVGKSSALNRLTGKKMLARTSKTPGRTQHIMFFQVNETSRLVDLPGYGFAKVPLSIKKKWQKNMDRYFTTRKCLKGLILPMDIRHPLTELDQQMIEYCMICKLPVLILLTKADKLTRNHANKALQSVTKRLDDPYYASLSYEIYLFSAIKGTNEDQIRARLYQWLEIS